MPGAVDRAEFTSQHLHQSGAAVVTEVNPIPLQHRRFSARHPRPIDHPDIGPADQRVDDQRIHPDAVIIELGDRDEHHLPIAETIDDLLESSLIVSVVAAEVGTQIDHDRVEVASLIGHESLGEHPFGIFDVFADLCSDMDLPPGHRQCGAHLTAVALGGRCGDRITDHQQAVTAHHRRDRTEVGLSQQLEARGDRSDDHR